MVGTHLLPPNLLRLFAPRPPLPYLKPLGRDPDVPLASLSEKKRPPKLGVWDTVKLIREEREKKLLEDGKKEGDVKMEDVKEEGEETKMPKDEEEDEDVKLVPVEALKAKRETRAKERKENFDKALKEYNPAEDPEALGDPYKTLFISRLPLTCTSSDLRREFEIYGRLERVRIVRVKEGTSRMKGRWSGNIGKGKRVGRKDKLGEKKMGKGGKKREEEKDTEGKLKEGVSRGYAFLVFEREKDMKAAYKDAEGLKIDGKRLLIDVERGRTVKGWKPRRLGGGLGGRPKKVVAAPADGFAPPFQGGGMMGGRGGGGFGGRGGGRGGFVQRGGMGGGMGGGRGGFQGGNRGGFGGGGQGGYGGGGFGGRGGFQQGPPGGFQQGGGFGGGDQGYGGGGRGGFGNGPPQFNGPRGGGIGSGGGNPNFVGGGGRGGFGGPGPDNGYGPRGGEKREFDGPQGGPGGYGDSKRGRY